jgi:hypothetical protein
MLYDGWEGEAPDTADFMNPQRYLCSQLVTLRYISGESPVDLVVNLEEIWEYGAVLESEEPLKGGTRAEIRCGTALFAGRIVQVEQHEFGWRLAVEFSPLTPWSIDKFQPQHLLNVSKRDKSG